MKVTYRHALTALLGLLVSPAAALAEEEWRFRLSPYLWFAGLEGDVATVPPLPTAPIDISPSDALDDTQASLMVIFEAKKGRHAGYLDFLHTDVESDDELVPQPFNLVLRSRTKSTIVTLAYEYELYNRDGAVIDLLAGGRYWSVDSKLSFRGGLGLLAGRPPRRPRADRPRVILRRSGSDQTDREHFPLGQHRVGQRTFGDFRSPGDRYP